MILFINVFITDKTIFGTFYDRGLFGPSDRLDVFKYSLASFSIINWSHVVIYYDVAPGYQNRIDEVDEYINLLFKNAIVYHYQVDRQSQWKTAMEEVLNLEDDEELVCFLCNDDHIFIDYETNLLERILNKLNNLCKDYQYVSFCPTHFPEHFNWRFVQQSTLFESTDCYAVNGYGGSAHILNKNLLRYWWFEHDYGEAWMTRSHENYRGPSVVSPPLSEGVLVIPNREMVRHFDGYSHIGMNLNDCPPLFIPEGFFENNIKILYCAEEPEPGYVLVNPLLKNYSAVDKKGADCRCLLEDLPLFWRSRISKIEVGEIVERNSLVVSRNQAVIKLALADCHTNLSLEELNKKLEVFLRIEGADYLPKSIPQGRKAHSPVGIVKSNWLNNEPKISVVVLNWTATLDLYSHTLESLSKQSVPRSWYEVIFVNHYYAPPSKLVQNADAVFVNLCPSGSYNKHIAYNLGLIAAKGEVVTFCDGGDVVVFPEDFIFSIIATFNVAKSDKSRSLVLLHNEKQTKESYPTESQDVNSSNIQKHSWFDSPKIGCTSVLKSDAINLGGFDENDSFIEDRGGVYELGKRLINSGIPVISSDEKSSIWRFSNKEPTKVSLEEYTPSGLLPLKENSDIQYLRTPYFGYVDEITDTYIKGWVYNNRNPETSLHVDIYANDLKIATTLANSYRKDLELAGFCSGHCSFFYEIPTIYQGNAITVRVQGCDRDLSKSTS